MRVLVLAVAGSVLLGCEDNGTEWSMDADSFAVVEATILDSQSSPIPSASVSGIGHWGPCDRPLDKGQVAGQSVSNQQGLVLLDLAAGLGGPGAYCVDFVVRKPGEAVADTVGGYPVDFFSGTPPDTSRLTITTSLN
jgi:hypothetical protein